MDPAEEEESLLFALELAFADDPTPRREGDEDEAGEGEAYARRRWRTRGCPTWTRRFLNSTSMCSVVVVVIVAVVRVLTVYR